VITVAVLLARPQPDRDGIENMPHQSEEVFTSKVEENLTTKSTRSTKGKRSKTA